MKKLFVIRHGKSDWNQGVIDFERPLNQRGIKDAPLMGRHLLNEFEIPDYIISSSANRAISTARLLLDAMNVDIALINQTEQLYHASVPILLREIANVPNDMNVIYLFGHNPGLSDLVSHLTGIPTELKTCCVSVLELQVANWNELVSETCILKTYLSPREL